VIVLPGRELAAITAARRLHAPAAVRQTPSDGSASTASEVVSTVNSVGPAALAAAETEAEAEAEAAKFAAVTSTTTASAPGVARFLIW
jgi:hypothetical protein